MAPRDSRKGKKVATSSPSAWTNWTWHGDGYYYRSRYDSSGQPEYDYNYPYPEASQPLQASQTISTSLGPATIATPYYSSSGSSNAATFASGASPSYATDSTVPRFATESGYGTVATSPINTSACYPQSSANLVRGPAPVSTDEAGSQAARPSSSGSNTGSERTIKYNATASVSSQLAAPSNIATQDYGRSSSPLDITSSIKNLAISPSLAAYNTSDPLYGESSSTARATSSYSNYTTTPPQNPPNQGTYPSYTYPSLSAPPQDTGVDSSASQSSNTGARRHGELDDRYAQINEKWFWRVGRVFCVLWTEPANKVPKGGLSSHGSQFVQTWLKGAAYTEIRRFVILQDGHGNCICSAVDKARPIHTYNGQATLKPNLPDRHQHAIIYTSQNPPSEHSMDNGDGEMIYEELSKDSIKVHREQKDDEGDLGTLSRLNYSKVYTVEKNLRVLNIGMVENIPSLLAGSFVKPRSTPIEKPRSHHSRSDPKKDGRNNRDKGKERSSGRRHHT